MFLLQFGTTCVGSRHINIKKIHHKLLIDSWKIRDPLQGKLLKTFNIYLLITRED